MRRLELLWHLRMRAWERHLYYRTAQTRAEWIYRWDIFIAAAGRPCL